MKHSNFLSHKDYSLVLCIYCIYCVLGIISNSSWYCEVVILNTTVQSKLHFPVLRWIEIGQRYKIPMNDTSLPEDDPFPDQRKRELEMSKKKYKIRVIDPGLPVQVSQLYFK